MARNGSGSYSRVNTFTAGSTITAAGHNQNWADLETEMTNSLAADGQTTMTGQFKAANGTVGAPGIAFGADLDSGIYRVGSDSLGFSVGGANVGTIAATSWTFPVQVLAKGTATNDSASAGYVGEYTESAVAVGSAVANTTGLARNVTSLSLTAGDWDVWGTVALTHSPGSSITFFGAWVSSTSATQPGPDSGGVQYIQWGSGQVDTDNALATGIKRFSLASTTTVYLSVKTIHSLAGQASYGLLCARRVR